VNVKNLLKATVALLLFTSVINTGVLAAAKSGTIAVFPGGNIKGVYQEGYTVLKVVKNANSGKRLAKGLTRVGGQQLTNIDPRSIVRLCRMSDLAGWECGPGKTIGKSDDYPFKKSKGFWKAVIPKTPDNEPNGTYVAIVEINGVPETFWFVFPDPKEKSIFWSFTRGVRGAGCQRSVAVNVLPGGGQTAYGQYVPPTISYTGNTLAVKFGTVHEYVARSLLFSLDPAVISVGAAAQWNTLHAPPVIGSFHQDANGLWETVITNVPPGCGNISYANGILWQMVGHPLLKLGAGVGYCPDSFGGEDFLLK